MNWTSSLIILATVVAVHATTAIGPPVQQPGKCDVGWKDRADIRSLNKRQRIIIVETFNNVFQTINGSDWKQITRKKKKFCNFILRLDYLLNKNSLLFPYWNVDVDLKLSNPAKSAVFHSDLLPYTKKNTKEASNATIKAEFGVSKNWRYLPRLLRKKLRSSVNGQLFTVMYELYKIGNSSTGLLNKELTSNPFVYLSNGLPVSLVVMGSFCSNREQCYKSFCYSNTCSARIQRSAPESIQEGSGTDEMIKQTRRKKPLLKNKVYASAQKITNFRSQNAGPRDQTLFDLGSSIGSHTKEQSLELHTCICSIGYKTHNTVSEECRIKGIESSIWLHKDNQKPSTTTLLLVIPNPINAGILVEAEIKAEQEHDTCSIKTPAGEYKGNVKIKFSRYQLLSDGIAFYTNIEEAKRSLWTGNGYYRRLMHQNLTIVC